MLVMLFQNISRGYASWKRVKEVLDTKPQIKDGSYDQVTDTRGVIEFKDVSFAYPGSGQTVLDHIDLQINRGETIAITLQKSELFSVTIGENISWGGLEAKEADVKAAARVAQADEFISSTAEGYDTPVAERGMSLSGGQKQRISIARAVLKSAEILIFDDSTSALDLKTEADLYKALRETQPESTKIIVAQRIASVRNADRIVVMDSGRIAAVGTHEELFSNCRIYQDICRSQSGEESKGA